MKKELKSNIKEKYDLDKSYNLVYIDRNDYLEDSKKIEKIIQDGNNHSLDENWDWQSDAQYESIRYIIDELFNKYGEISEEDQEEIKDYLLDHDESYPNDDLIKNTPSQYFFYSLGIEDSGMEQEGGQPDEDRIKNISKRLRSKNPELKKAIKSIVNNSGYGGNVVILFEDDIDNLLCEGDIIEFGPKTEICIMDRMNGSGHSEAIGTTLKIRFDRKNLHSDDGYSGYSFTKDVCGMTKGFMEGGNIRQSKKTDKIVELTDNPKFEEEMKREKELEENWKKTGKCIFGDMNYKRHTNKPYRNEFPAGNKCTECGTFWID